MGRKTTEERLSLENLKFRNRHCHKCGSLMSTKAKGLDHYNDKGDPIYYVEYECPQRRNIFDGHNRFYYLENSVVK